MAITTTTTIITTITIIASPKKEISQDGPGKMSGLSIFATISVQFVFAAAESSSPAK